MLSWISEPLPFVFPPDLISCPLPQPPHQPPPTLTRTASSLTGGRVNAKRKRKSRAIKSNLTTYISTDAANFRQMVQHVTGVDFDFDFPHQSAVSPPHPKRSADTPNSMHYSSCSTTVLPTLDTSANFLLHSQQGLIGTSAAAVQGKEPVDQLVAAPAARDRLFQMDPLINCFPTLESWTVV